MPHQAGRNALAFRPAYVVLLTPDGTVFIHAQDMRLSGRKLLPAIHGAILGALGVDPGNPAGILAAMTAVAAESGGPFEAPGVPGASGYAAPLHCRFSPAPHDRARRIRS